ncbi:hypothetical protein HPB49_004142 [Dermacentor silvarum]|uniref:Uncharacterized protein n=1 Tax=Dermacentor silvarum TaxID=543639 RepID=A0ACB8C222_DERSI|nr:hypothetical protein HPB49_004142 [Dermacentor silvarum]
MVQEDIAQFVDIPSDIGGASLGTGINEPVVTGRALGEQVIKVLKALGLDLEKCIGICTDSGIFMVS